jgi:WD40 repeat protein
LVLENGDGIFSSPLTILILCTSSEQAYWLILHEENNMKQIILFFILVAATTISCAQGNKKVSFKMPSGSFMRFTPDNKFLVVAEGRRLEFYSSGTDTRIGNLSGKVGGYKASHTGRILDMDFTTDGEVMITSSQDEKMKLWKVPSGEVIQTISPALGAITNVRFVENKRYASFVTSRGILGLWDIQANKLAYSTTNAQKPLRAYALSTDGKLVATAGGDEKVSVYETLTGNILRELTLHTNWVRALAFSPDSKILASAGDDKKIVLWNTDNGEKIRELPQKGWIHDLEFSADGKYLAAALERFELCFYNMATGLAELRLRDFKSGVMRLSISPNGNEVATIDEFNSRISLWNIESLNITRSIFFKDQQDKTAPLMFVSNPPNIVDNSITIYKDIIDLRGIISDESGIRSLKVNRIETPIKENGHFLINIPLAMGDNPITIEATDVNDNIALKKFTIVRKSMDGEKEYNALTAKNYLLVIGINNYQHWPKLNNAVKDVNDLIGVLMSKYRFDFDNISLLKDEQATRMNIHNSLRSFIEKVTPVDNLVIYFSGHGHFDQVLNEGYWIPVEAHTNSSSEYVSNTEVLKIIGTVNSQHTFLIADACFSGALFSDPKRSYTDNIEKYRSRWALTSGRLETVSDGTAGTNSPFAKHVLQFLDSNEKEKFAISELIHFVKFKVSEDSQQTPIGNPLRALGDEGGEMVIYKKQ